MHVGHVEVHRLRLHPRAYTLPRPRYPFHFPHDVLVRVTKFAQSAQAAPKPKAATVYDAKKVPPTPTPNPLPTPLKFPSHTPTPSAPVASPGTTLSPAQLFMSIPATPQTQQALPDLTLNFFCLNFL